MAILMLFRYDGYLKQLCLVSGLIQMHFCVWPVNNYIYRVSLIVKICQNVVKDLRKLSFWL